ncbi:MAG: hypothetical protein HOC77_07145 [Chloroflexi bacterium]|nr:hypothetical protein [Chloroflexota bacterium]MBT5319084.1 hypothetical protein [Chloroflexota bacterium]
MILGLVTGAIGVIAIACGGFGDGLASPANRAAMLTTPEATITLPVGGGVPTFCPPAEHSTLQDIVTTPASPYFVQHPEVEATSTPTVIFLPGGVGSKASAVRVWANLLSEGDGAEMFRLVVPYFEDADLVDDTSRVFRIYDEVLACYGGDASQIHIAGTSNGGLAAFAIMMAAPDRFASLLGAPGAFPNNAPAFVSESLRDKPVFNGVGENDVAFWKPTVKLTHAMLEAAGIGSVYVEFADQGHRANLAFDETVFFDFWRGLN